MSLVTRHMQRELQRIFDGLGDSDSRHVVPIEQIEQFSNLSSELARHLQSAEVVASRNVVLDGVLNHVDDVYTALDGVALTWNPESRLINVSYNRLWRPFVRAIRRVSRRQQAAENWIPPDEISNLLEQTGFEIVDRRTAVIIPVPVPLIARLFNRWLAPLPILRLLCVYNIVVARPLRTARPADPSISIVVAARNEAGNIEPLMRRIPQLAARQEVVFVEGGSSDDTWGAIQRVIAKPPSSGTTIKAFKQQGKGKGDAVRLGFSEASGDILIILDADISVPPEELTRFIDLLRLNSCEFANGSRLVYPMEKQAMQFLNLIGNRLFGVAFTFLLGQPVRDTLCGTKALWATDYHRIANQRSYFGDFDPFGDFDLLFGAARLHLKIRDVPVHYKERVYGSTNISRFRHGVLLLRMTLVAARKLRFV